jgi:hypothetical protein
VTGGDNDDDDDDDDDEEEKEEKEEEEDRESERDDGSAVPMSEESEDGIGAREAFLAAAYSREALVLRDLAGVRRFKQGLQRFVPASVTWYGEGFDKDAALGPNY